MSDETPEFIPSVARALSAEDPIATEHSHLYARALSAPLRDSDISREGVTAFAERRKANYGESAN